MSRYLVTMAVGCVVAGLVGTLWGAWGVPVGLVVHFTLFVCWTRSADRYTL